MELCDSCKKTLCDKKMEITKQGDIVTIRCKEYEKDASKIQGYKKQLCRTASSNDFINEVVERYKNNKEMEANKNGVN